ncbi:putative fluoride ion transporter CrcB [Kipferlia bialata]|uniref:Fluoride ion transporter CrcB n=1 Tax=Kipferlia bialata TaxID=797122 RepID=A0A9K3D549_9EUKA|nr:putative fluoride ion transporter CrcB [Kipferlia bialata]|eukprot:g10366.t1
MSSAGEASETCAGAAGSISVDCPSEHDTRERERLDTGDLPCEAVCVSEVQVVPGSTDECGGDVDAVKVEGPPLDMGVPLSDQVVYYALITLYAATGCLSRYLLSRVFSFGSSSSALYFDVIPNCLGCLILGGVGALSQCLPPPSVASRRHGLLGGAFCGSLTTLSGWIFQAGKGPSVSDALGVIVIGVLTGLGSFWLGGELVTALFARDTPETDLDTVDTTSTHPAEHVQEVSTTEPRRPLVPALRDLSVLVPFLLFIVVSMALYLSDSLDSDSVSTSLDHPWVFFGSLLPFACMGATTRITLCRLYNKGALPSVSKRLSLPALPWGTFASNILGVTLYCLSYSLSLSDWAGDRVDSGVVSAWHLSVTTHLCGSMTTLSSFIGDATRLAKDKGGKGPGGARAMLLYVLGTIGVCVAVGAVVYGVVE